MEKLYVEKNTPNSIIDCFLLVEIFGMDITSIPKTE